VENFLGVTVTFYFGCFHVKLTSFCLVLYTSRGDIPFCTEECRMEQIEMDEEMERKETTSKTVAQRASSPKDVESPPRPPKARAGSILAG
jgi:hypothetical protein